MEMILSALIVMLVGMGFVFAFLLIQVICTTICSKIGAKYSYLLPEPTKAVKKKAPAAAAADTEVVAVIAAALRQEGKLSA